MTQIALQPVDSVNVTTLMDNVTDMIAPDVGPAKRAGLARQSAGPTVAAPLLEGGRAMDALLAEHGFSLLVETSRQGRTHRILFDAGITPNGVAENMRRLEISPKDVEVVVISHGHMDHATGLDGFIRAVGRPSIPVIIHPEFWTRRRITVPGHDPVELPSTSKSALAGAGFEVIEERRPSFLLDGALLVTGEVDRTTDFERGFPPQQRFHDGQWEPDPLVLDEQALIVHVRDRGLVVITGCGHAGIVNILRYARKLTGVTQLYAVIGGFHLGGPLFEPTIPLVCNAFAEFAPTWIVPAHCTGWRAHVAIATRFPDAYLQNTVGTRFEL